MTVPPSASTDETGRYPNLVGYVPTPTGRRAVMACGEFLLGASAWGLATLVGVILGGTPLAGMAPLVVVAAFVVAELWCLVFRATRLAGLFMKATFVDAETGALAPGRLVLSSLLAAVLGMVTFGIGPVIVFFATPKGPYIRNWFDRVAGIMLVDGRTGRRPGDPVPMVPSPVPQPAAEAPEFLGWPTWAPEETGSNGLLPQPGRAPMQAVQPATPDAQLMAPIAEPPAPAAQPTPSGDGLITTTPFAAWAPPVAGSASPPANQPPAIREMRSVPAAEAANGSPGGPRDTPVASDATQLGAPALALSDGRRIDLAAPAALGRNPAAPGSHPDAVPYLVNDPLTSKTHVLFGADQTGAWVIDLHSTNGVWASPRSGEALAKLAPGKKTYLATGARVRFGDQIATVIR